MQFKNPEILYALFALIIPILVHLFQLQKFKKIIFTNVDFLKKIELQTRKSSRLKKWLVLASRMLLFTCIIFAFSQPYFSNKNSSQKTHNFIYFDNSISLNATGKKGTLLPVAAQEIIENISDEDTFSLMTNSNFHKNLNANELKNILKKIDYTTNNSTFGEILLKINVQKNNETNSSSNIILISDFQTSKENIKDEFTNVKTSLSLIQLHIEQKNNLSIDSIYIGNKNQTNFTLHVLVKNQGASKNNIPISIFNKETLLSKRSFSIGKDAQKIIDFEIQNQPEFLGEIKIQNNDTFLFDNNFFFSINYDEKIKVLNIGKTSNDYPNIFTEEEFIFSQVSDAKINYNAIPKQQLIILNELEVIPPSLTKSIEDFVKKGGALVVIPNRQADLNSYNNFFRNMRLGTISKSQRDSLKITTIHYDHPLFKDVFTKKIQNFQYPSVVESFVATFRATPLLSFENTQAFLSVASYENGQLYWFSSPISTENSNFTNSPLIVPTLYNIGQNSLQLAKLYYTLQQKNTIELQASIGKDNVVSIQNEEGSFIPLQQNSQNKISITTTDIPETKGFYHIIAKDTLSTVSYNNPTTESSLNFLDIRQIANENENITSYDSIGEYFGDLKEKNKVQWLWKLFLALAIVSLLLEVLILKFFKT